MKMFSGFERAFDDPLYQTYLMRREQQMHTLQHEVASILRIDYGLSPSDINVLINTHFDRDYLPNWYFHSTMPDEIARHIFLITQKLDANTEYLTQVSDDGRMISYIVNVGRDVPGKLLQMLHANKSMGIVAFDSVKTRTGIWIKTVERKGRTRFPLKDSETEDAEKLKQVVRRYLGNDDLYEDFLSGLPVNYLIKELNRFTYPRRILRHADIFRHALSSGSVLTRLSRTDGEIDAINEKLHSGEQRLCVYVKNPDDDFIINVLGVFERLKINLNHSCYDLFSSSANECTVGILSLHVSSHYDLRNAISEIEMIRTSPVPASEKRHQDLEFDLETIVKTISIGSASDSEVSDAITRLREYVDRNTDTDSDEEIGDFLLNSLSDFFTAAEHIGIEDNTAVLKILLGYDAFDEFWVETRFEGNVSMTEGYRTKHNSARGGNKGGLRIDMVVKFVEVAALAFMMTWKCARSRILFGGGKGGLRLNPKDYAGNSIDYFDTLTNFGRHLFLVTGSLKDIPAGDVGCGGLEIGHLFEGFKSALRDLAMTIHGIKKGVSFIGNTVISIEGARTILQDNFGIDCDNQKLIERLATDEDYLELVVASQITGKPKLGLGARNGATGSGLKYSLFATILHRYLDGEWESGEELTAEEHALAKKTSQLSEADLIADPDAEIISDEEWAILDGRIFPKLLRNKRAVIQGSGDVGGSIMRRLVPYGVRIIAVADAGGAVIGNDLDADELISAVEKSRSHPDKSRRSSVINTTQPSVEIIIGAKEGSVILTYPCDILIPAALENAITVRNAADVHAPIVACGSNGSNSSKAEKILYDRGITVIYDFLANGGGVDMSYAEWLTSLAMRMRYESKEIFGVPFDINRMDRYIMPEFRGRIKKILLEETESDETTAGWNRILRDIMFTAVNEDYTSSKREGISMKTAGFSNAIRRVLSANILRMSDNERHAIWNSMPESAKSGLIPFLEHPESELFNPDARMIIAGLGNSE